MKRLGENPWLAGALILLACLAANCTAPASVELSSAAESQTEFAAYQRGLTDGARMARLRCGEPLITTQLEQ